MDGIYYMRCDCAVWPLVVMNSVGHCGRCGKVPDRIATADEYEEDRKQWD